MFLGNGESPAPSQKKAGAYQAKSETCSRFISKRKRIRALVVIRNLRGQRVNRKPGGEEDRERSQEDTE
jgi:hypothetical protein